jgi:hypothetical protein
VHGDFTRPDDDAPAAQRGQRPSFVGACSARIFVAEPCSAMNRTRASGQSRLLGSPSGWPSLVFCAGITEPGHGGRAAGPRVEPDGARVAMAGRVWKVRLERVGWVSGTAGSCRIARLAVRRTATGQVDTM